MLYGSADAILSGSFYTRQRRRKIMAKPLVAIVGRPNVGKSTFFNKMAGHRISIVDDLPGVTRDRIYADVEWLGKSITLIDTGGIDPRSEDELFSQMKEQAEIAIDTADLICFFTDGRDGLTDDDREVAALLRRTQKPVILVINKIDYPGMKDHIYEFYELGFGDPVGISSANMLGFGDLLDEIFRKLPEQPPAEENPEHILQLAIVGRPNVGKSSLANRLLGEKRTMVSDIAGTTRDAVDSRYVAPDGSVLNIIDTAGIRRKRSVEDETLERYSVLRSIAAIKRCDVALLLIDAQEGVTEQDTKIAGLIHDEGKASVILVNKWDLVEKETGTFEKTKKKILDSLKFLDYSPVLFVSALTGQRVQNVISEVQKAYAAACRRITTGLLNDVINEAVNALAPPLRGGRRLKIYYATQQSVAPPTFLLFVNDEKLMFFAYERYLENYFRKTFDFSGTPIRFQLRPKKKEDS